MERPNKSVVDCYCRRLLKGRSELAADTGKGFSYQEDIAAGESITKKYWIFLQFFKTEMLKLVFLMTIQGGSRDSITVITIAIANSPLEALALGLPKPGELHFYR